MKREMNKIRNPFLSIIRVSMKGSRFKVQGSRFKVQGSRFKVQGSNRENHTTGLCHADCRMQRNMVCLYRYLLHNIIESKKQAHNLNKYIFSAKNCFSGLVIVDIEKNHIF